MPIGLYFAPASMNADQYRTCIQRLEAAGAGAPEGRLYHACFGEGDRLQVFDVWESVETFQAFGPVLMPILQELGVDPGQPQVMPMVNAILGRQAVRA